MKILPAFPHLDWKIGAIVGVGLLLTGISSPPPAEAQRLAVPKQGAYTGAYIDWGDTEDDVSYEKIVAFDKLVGKPQAIIAFSSFWGTEVFPSRQVDAVRKYGAIPLIYWSPWGPPYEQNKPQPRFDLVNIINGKFDPYIRAWARSARAIPIPILVSWGLEMNGTWFPWGGPCQGGGETRLYGSQSRADGPEKYVAAYRHVVDLVRSEGVKNISWVFHAQNYSWPVESWNTMSHYYPGDDYVDWLGMSVYGKQTQRWDWLTFDTVMRKPYAELSELNATKPIMLAEWGVGEFPRMGDKAAFFDEAFASMKKDYPRLKAAVYWHERWQNDNELYSNLRVNSSPRALDAYRRGVADPFWFGRPVIH